MGPATFRGVPFYVDTSERVGGRRLVTHEYPGRDLPFREDLGARSREFPVEGYVLGSDYLAKRDALLTALEASGPGELVHPYHGALRVAVARYSVRETARDGGMATFSIEFVETPTAPAQPVAVVDAPAAVSTSVDAALVAVEAEFLAEYAPGVRMDGPEEALRAAAVALDTAVAEARMSTQDLALIRSRIDTLTSSAASLVNVGADVFAALADVFDVAPNTVLDVYSFNPGERPPSTTMNRVIEQENFDALQALIQRLAVVRAAELLPEQTFDSYEAAVAARDAVTDALDEQMETSDDSTFPALQQLRADLVRAVPGEDSSLPHLVTYTPPVSVPSLVLAHRLYGSVSGEADILARNSVRNPLCVVGGVELEVLSDG